MQTLAALDALAARVLNDAGALIGQLVIAAITAGIAWLAHRHSLLRAKADAAVAEAEALAEPKSIAKTDKHLVATTRLAEALGRPVHVKLGNEVQAAWKRREARVSKPPPEPPMFPDDVPTIPDRPAVKRPPLPKI